MSSDQDENKSEDLGKTVKRFLPKKKNDLKEVENIKNDEIKKQHEFVVHLIDENYNKILTERIQNQAKSFEKWQDDINDKTNMRKPGVNPNFSEDNDDKDNYDKDKVKTEKKKTYDDNSDSDEDEDNFVNQVQENKKNTEKKKQNHKFDGEEDDDEQTNVAKLIKRPTEKKEVQKNVNKEEEQKEPHSFPENSKGIFETIAETAKNENFYDKDLLKKYNQNLKNFYLLKNAPKIISELKPLEVKAAEYKGNQAIRNTLLKMKEEFSHFREIKGDGNCFYRSIYFLYIESMLLKVSNKFDLEQINIGPILAQIFSKNFKFIECFCDRNSDSYELKKNLLENTQFLKNLAIKFICELIMFRINKPTQKTEFLDYFTKEIHENPCLDISLIVLMRSWIFKTYNQVKNLNSYKDYIGVPYEPIIQEFDNEARDLISTLTAEGLNLRIEVHSVDDSKNALKIVQNYSFSPMENKSPDLEVVHLFFRPGHYDCFYLKTYIEEIRKNTIQKKVSFADENVTSLTNLRDQKNFINEQTEKLYKNRSADEILYFCHFCNVGYPKYVTEVRKSETCGHLICQICLSEIYKRVLEENLDGARCKLDGNPMFDLKKIKNWCSEIDQIKNHQAKNQIPIKNQEPQAKKKNGKTKCF